MPDGIILAGGGSARIGFNKALLSIDGELLIERVIRVVETVVDRILVVVKKEDENKLGRYLENYNFNLQLVFDDYKFRNPLAGIYAGMMQSRSEYVIVLPCDTPFVKEDALRYLLEIAQGFDLTIPRWRNGYLEPLCAIYRRDSTLASIQEIKEKDMKDASLRDLIRRLRKVRYVPVDDLRRFDRRLLTLYNINTVQDYEKALEISRELRKANTQDSLPSLR